MLAIELCDTCGVPSIISRGLAWSDNGVINLSLTPLERMVFYEAGTIDHLFRGIEELIGLPVEHIIIESRRRNARKLMEKTFWGKIEESKRLAEEEKTASNEVERQRRRKSTMKLRMGLNLQASDLGRVYGYGSVEMAPPRGVGDEFPWRSQVVRKPYSLVFYAGDHLGTVEAFEQADMRITYEEVDEDTFRFSAYPGEHPVGLQERLKKRRYDFKPGGLSFPRCPECNVPSDISNFRWSTDDGTITDPYTGNRMAFFDPLTLDAVIDDLAAELGDPILDLAIEAQRRYIKTGAGNQEYRREKAFFRDWAALRGLGNVTDFISTRDRTTISLENACLPLALVGTAQAFCELALGIDRSSCQWEIGENGVLSIDILG